MLCFNTSAEVVAHVKVNTYLLNADNCRQLLVKLVGAAPKMLNIRFNATQRSQMTSDGVMVPLRALEDARVNIGAILAYKSYSKESSTASVNSNIDCISLLNGAQHSSVNQARTSLYVLMPHV